MNKKDTSIFSTMSKLARDHDAINLGQGFPEFACDPVLLNLASKYLMSGKNQYAPMAGVLDLRVSLSEKINKIYNLPIDPETQLCVTAGATEAIFTAINAFVSQGDEVVIVEPAYDSYKPSIKLAGGIPVIYTLEHPNYQIDWDKFSQLISDKTSLIIINTPHNPTGSILSETDLKTLESLTTGKDIIVMSDEVYEHIIFDGEKHQSVLNFPQLFKQSVAIFSFGKTFHATGWKLGYCVGPHHLMDRFKNIHQWNVFSVNSFLQYALAEYLKDESNYLSLPNFFQEKRDYLNSCMSEVPLRAIPTKGTYFQLYDYSEVSDLDDLSFAKMLVKEYGVASIPISPFKSADQDAKVIRFCFAKHTETLQKAADKLKRLNG